MTKIPAFQFYPSDWRSDNGVQALGYFERGVWFEMLCLMHESEQRGQLLLNGRPMTEDALARLLGLDRQALSKTLTTLLDLGVCSRDENGILFSRRMRRDEEARLDNAERQRRHYQAKKKPNGQPNAEPNGNLTGIQQKSNAPSSISSSSSTSEEKIHTYAGAEFPLKDLLDAFPEVQFTPAQLGMIEAEVKPTDAEAWRRTIDTYKANYNPLTNTYRPEKVGNLLNVLKAERVRVERENEREKNTNGKPKPNSTKNPLELGDTDATLRSIGVFR